MSKYLVSLDPSFTRTGICILNLETKKIYFHTASCKIGEKQFENIVHAAQSVVKQISDIIYKYCSDNFDVISESPLPCSSMSSALYSLDTLIYHELNDHIKKTYNPATLKSKIHGHKYDKKDSMDLANKYIDILSKNNYIIESDMGTKKKICHDCCEAFLYAWLFLHESSHSDFQFDNSDEIRSYKERMKVLKKKEKELLNSKPEINVSI